MAASKKDYEAVASVMYQMHARALTHREHTLLANITVQLASRFRLDNAQFDNARFLQASGASKYLNER